MQKPSLIRSALSIPTLTDRDGRTWTQGHDIQCTGVDPENELGGGQFRGFGGRKSPSGVQGRSPGRGSGERSPPEADDFSQLKGYLDVLWRDVK